MTTLQACLNGGRTRAEHDGVPIAPKELGAAAAEVAALGVTEVHVHPRDDSGAESLRAEDVVAAVRAIRAAAPGTEVGVTTRAEACTDRAARLRLVEDWPGPQDGGPDFASVNWHEPGAADLASALAFAGIEVEAGIFTPAAATAFGAVVRDGIRRVLVEAIPGVLPGRADDPEAGVAVARTIRDALLASRTGDVLRGMPTLVHGEEGWAWPVLDWAWDEGFDVRIGLEDTLTRPGGRTVRDNAELVRIALGHIDLPETGHVLASDGARIYRELLGDGPTLVVLQPPGADVEGSFGPLLTDLARWRQVVAVELLDGRSLDRLAQDVVEVLAALDVGPADVLGLAGGAAVAELVHARTPDLGQRLVLVSAAPRGVVAGPVLVVIGDRDEVGVAAAYDAVRRLSRGELAVLPGTAAGEAITRSDLLSPLLGRFLA